MSKVARVMLWSSLTISLMASACSQIQESPASDGLRGGVGDNLTTEAVGFPPCPGKPTFRLSRNMTKELLRLREAIIRARARRERLGYKPGTTIKIGDKEYTVKHFLGRGGTASVYWVTREFWSGTAKKYSGPFEGEPNFAEHDVKLLENTGACIPKVIEIDNDRQIVRSEAPLGIPLDELFDGNEGSCSDRLINALEEQWDAFGPDVKKMHPLHQTVVDPHTGAIVLVDAI